MDLSRLKKVAFNDTEIVFVEQGEGEALVLVHGTLGDLRSWSGQIAPFAERYRVIAPSRRYHWPNASPLPADRYTIAQHVNDLAAFIDILGLAPVRLVGSSYGALTALVLTATRPEMARSLVLGEPPLVPWLDKSPEGVALRRAFVDDAWKPAGEASRRNDAEEMVRHFIDGVIGAGTFDRIPQAARAETMDNAPALALELESPPRELYPDLKCDELVRIAMPALLLYGEVSPPMFGRVQDDLANCLPGAERETIPNASHAMHAGNPGAYNETVLAFLDRT